MLRSAVRLSVCSMKTSRHILLWPLLCAVLYQIYIFYIADVQPLPTMKEQVEPYGYSLETYDVETEDGYILGLYRILKKRDDHQNKSVVFLQHGMASCSDAFVSAGPNISIAFLLADRGHDVWLGNSRGSTHSKRHRTLDISSSEFWHFSYHEMGHYDLKTMVDKALQVSGQKSLNFVGHSMGSNILLALLTTRPEYNEKITHGFLMAPTIYINPIYFYPAYYFAQYYAKWRVKLWDSEFLPKTEQIAKLGYKYCSPDHPISYLCYLAYQATGPSSQSQETGVRMAPSTAFSSTALRVFAQLALNYNTDRFNRMADPPIDYDLNLVTIPLRLIYSDNDYLAVSQNVRKLNIQLSNSTLYHVPVKEFNHLDFLFGKDVVDLVYKEVFRLV